MDFYCGYTSCAYNTTPHSSGMNKTHSQLNSVYDRYRTVIGSAPWLDYTLLLYALFYANICTYSDICFMLMTCVLAEI